MHDLLPRRIAISLGVVHKRDPVSDVLVVDGDQD